MVLLKTFLFLIVNLKPLMSLKTKIECGYKQCPQTREGALNVHLISHSHMDAGWVKTFDEYYYGTRSTVSTANVQLIYHSVLSELLHDKRRKFTFSETAYFWRWWKEQRPQTRGTFRSLVQEGRIQFAGAGWTHADSSTVSFLHALDQATWGLRKLNDTLGPCGKPKAAWQIDTYGHSREMTSLFAQMGFDGLFIGRVDHKEREAMMEEDRMEFMWRGSDVLGKMSDIMTHTMFNLYNAPDGFCFDYLCNDEPIVDDPDSRVYNADKRVNDFILQIERQAKYYDHDNIMVTMGGDFTYQSAASWFMNIDKLINHVNTHPANMSDINIFYSTPACYLKAIYLYGRRDKAIYTEKFRALHDLTMRVPIFSMTTDVMAPEYVFTRLYTVEFPSRNDWHNGQGDLLPYGSDASTYWTGFYTSRPSLKYFIRRSHVFLQVLKQLTVIAQSVDSYELHLLRHAVGLLAHHDAITGTSQQHVANDFTRILSEAVDICSKKASNLLSYLTPTWGSSRRSNKNNHQFILCHQLNMSQCRFIESQDSILLLVYNPLSVKTYHYVRLPAIAVHYSVRDHNDEEVEYQLLPLPAAVINLPGRASNTIQELCFEAENIPPLGYSAYLISPIRDQLEENQYAKKQKEPNTKPETELISHISNEYIKVAIDPATGLLESIQHIDGVRIQVSQNFYYYSQTHQTLQSGAYTFRPVQERPVPVAEKVSYLTIRGTLVKEIRQRFSDWVTQIIRLFRGEEFIEFEWIIGPVPTGSDLGKEVVTILTTNITNNGEFFTDSNGRSMVKRSCWNETSIQQLKKPLPSCYYPVTSKICLKSSNTSVGMCVLTDRTQGGTSYKEGEIELMVHRRLLTDDGFGLEESLNEEAHGVGLVVKGKHRLVFGNYRVEADGLNFAERVSASARRWEYEPYLFFTSGDKISKRKWLNVRNKRYSALKVHGLPRHIQILTLEPWKGGSVLLRLENTLEKTTRGTPPRYKRESEPPDETSSLITVELRKIFLQLKIKTVRETTLGANQWLDDARQMDWSTRYVYSGGDDGILPEDIVEDEDPLPKVGGGDKDYDRYSEEESETKQDPRRSGRKQNRVKSFRYSYDRHKRSFYNTSDYTDVDKNLIIDLLNNSELKLSKIVEINDNKEIIKRAISHYNNFDNNNLIIDLLSDKIIGMVEFDDNVQRTKRSTVNETVNNNVTVNNDTGDEVKFNESVIGKVTEKVDLKFKDTTIEQISTTMKTIKKNLKKNTKTKANNNIKLRQQERERDEDEEVRSSEEDFSSNLKKKSESRKRKNRRNEKKKKEVEEFIYDDSDDGITKSIYEMYYKPKNPYKEDRRKITEDTRENKELYIIKNKDIEDTTENKYVHKIRNKETEDSVENKEQYRLRKKETKYISENKERLRLKKKDTEDSSENKEPYRLRNKEIEDITEKTERYRMKKKDTEDSSENKEQYRMRKKEIEDITENTERHRIKRKETEDTRENKNRHRIRKNNNMPFLSDRYNAMMREKEENARNKFKRRIYGDSTQTARLRRRNINTDDDDDYYNDDDDDYDSLEHKTMVRSRRRRDIPPKEDDPTDPNTSEADPVEPEYVITLRPTQIRTFVIWFERNKKPYTL